MKYLDGVEYDILSMRMKICPKCKNEEFSEKAEFCRICGADLYNRCEGEPVYSPTDKTLLGYENQHVNPSNARFCETCGKPTVFLKTGILADYEHFEPNSPDPAPYDQDESCISRPSSEARSIRIHAAEPQWEG